LAGSPSCVEGRLKVAGIPDSFPTHSVMRAFSLMVLTFLVSTTLAAQDRAYGRSMTITPNGIVATSHTLASQAGAQILAKGGSAAGWAAMHKRFGKLPWSTLFDAAIYYAEHGYAVPEIIHDYWSNPYFNDEGKRVFLPNGRAPEVGEIFRNPDYAKALRILSKQGPDSMYGGEIGKAIVATSNELGGTMTVDDLAKFSPEWVEPISTRSEER